MKLRLYNVHEHRTGDQDDATIFRFRDENGRGYTAEIIAEKAPSPETAKRWYELICAFITANGRKEDLWIVLAEDLPPGVTEIGVSAEFTTEIVSRDSYAPPKFDNRERERKDLDA